MRLAAYDYALPPERIAQFPFPQRDQARMMHVARHSGAWQHGHVFADLPSLLSPGDCVVMNNTQVIPARLMGRRAESGGRIELLLLTPAAHAADCWWALGRPARKLYVGARLYFGPLPEASAPWAEVIETGAGARRLVKIDPRGFASVETMLEALGQMPIPPYLRREAVPEDKERYQTVVAQRHASLPGSQAAPTAGLHMTPQVLAALADREIEVAYVTLAVGTGTFRSVDADDIQEHAMDAEAYALPAETAAILNSTKARGGRIVAIGTTSVKTLETVAKKYSHQPFVADAGFSDLFIYPGFSFEAVTAMVTNFHLPKSTLMMLVSAFAGRPQILAAYNEAVAQQYRFYSYGDCMLLM
jgi:S-adenosylmethionine:tRNA ribosyltransferase-isomerase